MYFTLLHTVARGRRSTYFPSPPESTEPPIIPEVLLESEELKPKAESPAADHEPEHLEPAPEPESKPVSAEVPGPEQTASYEWPLNSPKDDGKVQDKVICSSY